MKIIAAWDLNTKEVLPDEVVKKDRARLRLKHRKAILSDPTWAFFGGVLTIQDRRYQVVEEK